MSMYILCINTGSVPIRKKEEKRENEHIDNLVLCIHLT